MAVKKTECAFRVQYVNNISDGSGEVDLRAPCIVLDLARLVVSTVLFLCTTYTTSCQFSAM